jgi:hypothetical protein
LQTDALGLFALFLGLAIVIHHVTFFFRFGKDFVQAVLFLAFFLAVAESSPK